MPEFTIRPEAPRDYAAIGAVNAHAFGNRASEPAVIALRRQLSSFEPELSLVAESGGRVVGHILFSPERIRLLDADLAAVNLAPVAVEPEFQRRGIGGALIEEGHRIARAKGFSAAFLLGYPAYYARFGYRGRAFGAATSVVRIGALTEQAIEARGPVEQDIAALRAVWLHEEGGVDFAIDPGPDLLGWLSPNPAVRARVYLRAGEVCGYTRVHAAEPLTPRMFAAADAEAARAIAEAIVRDAGAALPAEVVLPLHPSSASARVFGNSICDYWEYGMACPLAPGPLDEFFARLAAGARVPGAPVWPTVFDLA